MGFLQLFFYLDSSTNFAKIPLLARLIKTFLNCHVAKDVLVVAVLKVIPQENVWRGES